MFKKTYPYVCDKCGYLHWKNTTKCEGCGDLNTIRKITKKDWKKHLLAENLEAKKTLI